MYLYIFFKEIEFIVCCVAYPLKYSPSTSKAVYLTVDQERLRSPGWFHIVEPTDLTTFVCNVLTIWGKLHV